MKAPALALVALAVFATAASPRALAEPGPIRHTLGLDVSVGYWFGGLSETNELRYGLEIIPELEFGAKVGIAASETPLPMFAGFVRARPLRGHGRGGYVGHALAISVDIGLVVHVGSSVHPYITPMIGWEFRTESGFGFGIDAGLSHALDNESGLPLARARINYTF